MADWDRRRLRRARRENGQQYFHCPTDDKCKREELLNKGIKLRNKAQQYKCRPDVPLKKLKERSLDRDTEWEADKDNFWRAQMNESTRAARKLNTTCNLVCETQHIPKQDGEVPQTSPLVLRSAVVHNAAYKKAQMPAILAESILKYLDRADAAISPCAYPDFKEFADEGKKLRREMKIAVRTIRELATKQQEQHERLQKLLEKWVVHHQM